MYATAVKKIELMDKIAHLSERKFDEVNLFVDFVLAQSKGSLPESINLRGIWKNKGFEKIQSLESEIRDVRKEISDAILKRRI